MQVFFLLSRKIYERISDMKEFTPDKYLGHKINRISRSIDRYFDRKRCSKTECIPRSQGMMIGYIMDNQGQNIFKKDIEAKFHLSGATVTNMLKSLEKTAISCAHLWKMMQGLRGLS